MPGDVPDLPARTRWLRRTHTRPGRRPRGWSGSPRGAQPIAAAAVAEVEAESTAHLGTRQMAQLRRALGRLRAVTDTYA